MRVLIVDDDKRFARLLQLMLEAETEAGAGAEAAPIRCTCAADADSALAALAEAKRPFDLVLLDVDMPGMSGWDLLYAIRLAGNELPVIFVSGQAKLEDRVRGLDLGADDYILKPFDTPELLARMKAVLRRREAQGRLVFGDVSLDLASRHVHRNEVPIQLTPREFDLLSALVRARGALVSREDLLAGIWGLDFDTGTNVLDVHIGRLRRKLDKHGPPLIMNVRGEGYQLESRAANHT